MAASVSVAGRGNVSGQGGRADVAGEEARGRAAGGGKRALRGERAVRASGAALRRGWREAAVGVGSEAGACWLP